jgi:hypothetical protein
MLLEKLKQMPTASPVRNGTSGSATTTAAAPTASTSSSGKTSPAPETKLMQELDLLSLDLASLKPLVPNPFLLPSCQVTFHVDLN